MNTVLCCVTSLAHLDLELLYNTNKNSGLPSFQAYMYIFLHFQGYGIAMAHNTPYKPLIDMAITHLKEQGVLHKLHIKWWKQKRGDYFLFIIFHFFLFENKMNVHFINVSKF